MAKRSNGQPIQATLQRFRVGVDRLTLRGTLRKRNNAGCDEMQCQFISCQRRCHMVTHAASAAPDRLRDNQP